VRNVNYDKWKPNEDHIEWWEQKPACIGEAADVSVFKHMLAGRLGRRGYASLPGALFKLQEIPLADFGVVSWLEHEYLQNSKGGLGWVNKSGIVKAPQCSSVIFLGPAR
jgi:hypothetical protein